MTTINTPRRPSRKTLTIGGISLIGILVLAVLAWQFMYSKPVTDTEARDFAAKVNSVALSDPDELCQYALFDKKCQREIDNGLKEQIGSEARIVCTWPLKGGDGTRVVEIENVNTEGKSYRTSLAISRDASRLTAWPMPYWEYPTRDIPSIDPDTNVVEDLPDRVEVGGQGNYDPCLSPQSTQ